MNWFDFCNSDLVPENERGFWYRGVVEKLRGYYLKAMVSTTRRVMLPNAFSQIYNTSPLLSALLSEQV